MPPQEHPRRSALGRKRRLSLVPSRRPAGDLGMEAMAVDQLPGLDTATVSPATEARLEELAARKAAQAEAAEDEAQREANREAYAAAELSAPEPGTPSAWVQGPSTPEWGGPQASAPSPRRPNWRPGCRRHRALYGSRSVQGSGLFGSDDPSGHLLRSLISR